MIGQGVSATLTDARVSTRLPASDLGRARRFYSERLGLEPVEERPGGIRYQCGGCSFALFQSAGAASGTHTQMAFEVEDIEATVAALRARGVIFEEYPKGLGSAIRMIQYFINRGGRRLPASRHRELERAKGILQRKQHSAR